MKVFDWHNFTYIPLFACKIVWHCEITGFRNIFQVWLECLSSRIVFFKKFSTFLYFYIYFYKFSFKNLMIDIPDSTVIQLPSKFYSFHQSFLAVLSLFCRHKSTAFINFIASQYYLMTLMIELFQQRILILLLERLPTYVHMVR